MIKKVVNMRIFLGLLGVLILSLSIVILLKTGLGVDALNALYVNLSIATGLSIGFFSFCLGYLFIYFSKIVSNKKFNWWALLIAFLIGNSIDLFNILLKNVHSFDSLVTNIIVFVFGMIGGGLGISLLIFSGMPSPLEEYQFAIQKLLKVGVATSKIYSDMSLFLMAAFIGFVSNRGLGQINVGTVVITLGMGKIIEIWIRVLKKTIKSYSKFTV